MHQGANLKWGANFTTLLTSQTNACIMSDQNSMLSRRTIKATKFTWFNSVMVDGIGRSIDLAAEAHRAFDQIP